jgi:hypothetical protein
MRPPPVGMAQFVAADQNAEPAMPAANIKTVINRLKVVGSAFTKFPRGKAAWIAKSECNLNLAGRG